MINRVRGEGCIAPSLLAKSTFAPGVGISSPIRAAIDGAVNGSDIFAGPDCDGLDTSYRYDNQHWNASGNAAAATLWRDAILAAL